MEWWSLGKPISRIWTVVCAKFVQYTREAFQRPKPQTAGYIFILAAGTGVSVLGALLPAYLSWWWLDTAGHFAGGITLALGLLVLFDRNRMVAGVVVLSIVWEATEWSIGFPFHVTPTDTVLDLLASWVGLTAVFAGTVVARNSD